MGSHASVLSAVIALSGCAFGGEEDVASREQALTADLAPTDSVGALPGSLSVDFDGQAHYTIPIEVPPARADHVPQLAFSYSSSDAVGSLGRGWSLSGLSSITRCARTAAIDGLDRAVAYDEEDAFCLDGARLVEAGEVDGVREYRTEQESFVRVFAFEESGILGPARWEVRRPDGSIVELGRSPNSRARISTEPRIAYWLADHLRDRFGNLVELVYQTAYPSADHMSPDVTGARGLLPEMLPALIRYGSHESGLEATGRLSFEYEPRPDVAYGHDFGLGWQRTLRLARVRTYSEDRNFRTYHVDYDNDGATGVSRVVTIQDCVDVKGSSDVETREGFVCRPATRFEWTHGGEERDVVEERGVWDFRLPVYRNGEVNTRGITNGYGASFAFLDVDGDGKSDVAYERDGQLWVKYGNADPAAADHATGTFLPDGVVGHRLDAFDVNRDGLDDLVFLVRPERHTVATAYYALSRGDRFDVVRTAGEFDARFNYLSGSEPPEFATQTRFITDFDPDFGRHEQSLVIPGDFDGDSLLDLLSCEVIAGESAVGIEVRVQGEQRVVSRGEWFIRRGSNGLATPEALGVPTVCALSRHPGTEPVVSDISGDGKSDVLFVQHAYLFGETRDGDPQDAAILAEDLEGGSDTYWFDELGHIRGPTLDWKVLTLDARHPSRVVSTGIYSPDVVFPYAVDVDGDGLLDLVGFDDGSRRGVEGPISEPKTLQALRGMYDARLERHVWRNLGAGRFEHHTWEDFVEPDARGRAEYHQPLLLRQRLLDAGEVRPDRTEFFWHMLPDVVSDFDSDGSHEIIQFGLQREHAHDDRLMDARDFDFDFQSGHTPKDAFVFWSDRDVDRNVPRMYIKVLEDRVGFIRQRQEEDPTWINPLGSPVIRTYSGTSCGDSCFTVYAGLTSAQTWIMRPADFDGDGDMDLAVAQVISDDDERSWSGGPAVLPLFRRLINQQPQPERVTAVVTGVGARTSIAYEPLTSSDVYRDEEPCGAGLQCDAQAARVVASVSSEASGHLREVRYRYWSARWARNGRGFLGFAKVAIEDGATGSVSTYRFDRRFDPTTNAYYTARRPVHVTHLVQGRNLKHGGDSSRTVGTELFVDYDLHTHDGRWSTVVAEQHVRQFEDVRYFGLDPYADEPFAGLTPIHTSTTRFEYGEDVPWSQRDLPFHVATSVDDDRDPAREYSEREYEPEPTIRPRDYSTPWIVGRVSAERSWVEGDDCESDVSVRMKYHPHHGGLEYTIRQPDDLAPPRSDEDRRAEVLESFVFYDAYGNVESSIVRDLEGNERTTKLHYEYPGATFPSAAENTLGHTVKAHFHPEIGAPFAVIDPNGRIEQTTFDGFGRVVGGSSATGDSFTVRYEQRDGDPVPLRIHTSTASGSLAAQGMNAAGQVVWSEWRELRNALPVTVRALRRYDAAGRVVEESEPFFEGESATHWTRHEYDDVGTLRVAQSPAGRFTYRRTPDRRMATDALGFETTLVLDGRGNVVQGIEPAPGGTIRHAYCADGRLRKTVDPLGNTTTIEYDTLGRRRYLNEPDRGEEWTDYDAFDQVVHTLDAGNRDVWLDYDPLGRLIVRKDVSGETTWKFDVAPHGLGALASTKSPDGIATEYSYHPNGLLESEKLYADSVALKLSYGYDAFGR
ncbi:MAG: hypothetical protein MUE69_26745, partial [Myxococcota bacterium]|nr:hypothetical protein [Myxococcota bacterium]